MASPRPVSGEPIASLWGQEVHDVAVLARGVVVGVGTPVGSNLKCPFGALISGDPTMVDAAQSQFVAPVDGLYEIAMTVQGGGATAASAYRIVGVLTPAGAGGHTGFSIPQYTTNVVTNTWSFPVVMTAGQRFHIQTATLGAGSAVTFVRGTFRLIAQGIA